MVPDEDIPYLSAVDLTQAIRTGKVSSTRALEVLLRRVVEVNHKVNAVVVLDAERARQRAKEADAALARGEHWGPLHGLPLTVKENLDVAGLPTCLGYPEHKDRIAPDNQLSVQRLLAAGAVIFGKTNLPLGVMDVQTYNQVYGSSSNPWDPSRTTGGSSGGSAAALACGMAPLEVGSDVGGSIRIPAAFCGVFGHKPTMGIIPRRGAFLSKPPPDISVEGPMARCPEDLALGLELLAGADDRIVAHGWKLQLPRPVKFRLEQFRVAVWADDPTCPVDDEMLQITEDVAQRLEKAGATVDRSARPKGFDPAQNVKMYMMLTAMNRAATDNLAGKQSLRDFNQAAQEREQVRDAWESFFNDFDVLICPSYPTPAFLKDESSLPLTHKSVKAVRGGKEVQLKYLQALFWAELTNTAWLPSTTFPCGVGPKSGLPLGLNVVSREYNDFICIDFVRLLTQYCGVRFSPPPGFLTKAKL